MRTNHIPEKLSGQTIVVPEQVRADIIRCRGKTSIRGIETREVRLTTIAGKGRVMLSGCLYFCILQVDGTWMASLD